MFHFYGVFVMPAKMVNEQLFLIQKSSDNDGHHWTSTNDRTGPVRRENNMVKCPGTTAA